MMNALGNRWAARFAQRREAVLRRPAQRRPTLARAAELVMPFVLFVVLWQMASLLVRPGMLPGPAAVLAEAVALTQRGMLPTYALRSLQALLIAAVVGVLAGIALGLLIASSRVVTRLLAAPISFLAATSEIAWLPMVLVWFGFTRRTVVYITIYTVFFPVLYSTIMGARSVPPVYARVLKTLGAGRLRTLWEVTIPGSVSTILTGTRLGIAYGWRTIIAAEIIVGASGLGFMLFQAQTIGNAARILAGMFVIGALWLTIDRNILRPIESSTAARWGLIM